MYCRARAARAQCILVEQAAELRWMGNVSGRNNIYGQVKNQSTSGPVMRDLRMSPAVKGELVNTDRFVKTNCLKKVDRKKKHSKMLHLLQELL